MDRPFQTLSPFSNGSKNSKGATKSLPPCHESGGQVLSVHAATTHINCISLKDTCTANDRCLQYIYFGHAYMLVHLTPLSGAVPRASALQWHMPYIMARYLTSTNHNRFIVVKQGQMGQTWHRFTIPYALCSQTKQRTAATALLRNHSSSTHSYALQIYATQPK